MIVECPGCKSRYDVTGRSAGTPVRCRCGKRFPIPDLAKEAATLGCPQCGAPVPSDSDRCRYCDARLAVITCPSCFGRVFLGSKFCSFCSAGLDAPAAPAPITEAGAHALRRCPRCPWSPPSPLVAHLSGEILLDECARCGGMYVERQTFERLVADREKRSAIFGVLDHAKSVASPEPDGKNSTVAYLRCPECQTLMNRTNFGKRSGVIIDVCAPHGVWFDRDELRRVLEFVQHGGLEETRRREIDEQKRLLLDRKMAASAHPMSTHDREGMRNDESALAQGVEFVLDALLSLW